MRYVYPAVFAKALVPDRCTVYTVVFPDVPGCITEGDSLSEAIENGARGFGWLHWGYGAAR